jgi:hypothetical protein
LLELFPASLFPGAEQEYASMRNQLNYAYDKQDAGQEGAVSDFYDEYPAYSLRRLIKETDPNEQLRMVLANQIWSRYGSLGGANKRQLRRYLGPEFDQFISDNDYRETVTSEQMAYWSSAMGNETPESAGEQLPPAAIPYVDPASDQAYTDWQNWRNENHPNWL